ncbi:cysteine desulfurase family protein [Diplocloster hominis]|uniref:cysteine desulfurase family protein n=1 Tax=Diplocloster hominis TaxID=3079010 RepID=UPI0031B9FA42
MIYFDNAATTVMSEASLRALIEISSKQYGNPSSAYSFGRIAKELLEDSRAIIADCIGAEAEEIFFTSCGTESDNWVISQAGSRWSKVITSKIEHHAILHPAEKCGTEGVRVSFLAANNQCIITKDELKRNLDGTPVLASVMMQNNETGVIQPVKELAEIVHSDNNESVFHTDAVQAVGHMRINVKEMGIDMLSASAHKFNGPKGVGFLYIRKDCIVNPYILGGGQENGLRSGTENVAGIYAMAKALEDNMNNLEENRIHIKYLEQLLMELLSAAGINFMVNGDSAHRAAGIINIAITGLDGEGLLNMLDMHDICISIGSACNSNSQNRTHVLKAMGISDEQIDSSVRISIGRYNTEDDVRTLVKWIIKYHNIATMTEA